MSFQDTLMNIVCLDGDTDDEIVIQCAWCDFSEWSESLHSANEIKMRHENEHGIYLDPDTGEMWYDAEENQHACEILKTESMPTPYWG